MVGIPLSAKRPTHGAWRKRRNIASRRVENSQDLGDALKWAIGQNSPVLLDVVMQPLHEANAPVSKWIA
jgi:acetolactate synthase-1/2/3 large subunit